MMICIVTLLKNTNRLRLKIIHGDNKQLGYRRVGGTNLIFMTMAASDAKANSTKRTPR